MRHCPLIGLMFCALCASAGFAVAGESRAADLGSAVREIFAVKCVQCHSASLPRPKGKFGYVLDLPRIAANPRLVVPSDAAHSKLWQKIEEGDMPPDDAKAGPLSDAQKLTIRAWIEAGAPAPALQHRRWFRHQPTPSANSRRFLLPRSSDRRSPGGCYVGWANFTCWSFIFRSL